MLSELLIIGGAAAAGGAIHRGVHRRRARRRHELVSIWASAAEQLGLAIEDGSGLHMFGSLGSISVRVETAHEGTSGAVSDVTRFHLEDASRIPLTFRVRRRARSGWLIEELEKSGIATGDQFLDTIAMLRGNEVRLTAVLNQRTRDLIKLAIGIHGATVGYGRITHCELGHVRSERRLIAVLNLMRDLCDSLAIEDQEIPRALYRNLSDRMEGVRRKNFQLLFEYFPESREAHLALPRAAADPDPVVRLSAALGRGIDGLPEIVTAIEDPYVGVPIKLYAIRQLALRYRGSLVRQTLEKLLESPWPSIATAALRAIAASHRRDLVPPVVRLLQNPTRSEDVLIDAISTLGALGDFAVEPDLLNLLRHPGLRVRTAAAYALGGVGTLNSIEPLLDTASGIFTHRLLKETARRAIRRIQDRIGAAGEGLLSLVDEDRGDLALAAPDGALSFE